MLCKFRLEYGKGLNVGEKCCNVLSTVYWRLGLAILPHTHLPWVKNSKLKDEIVITLFDMLTVCHCIPYYEMECKILFLAFITIILLRFFRTFSYYFKNSDHCQRIVVAGERKKTAKTYENLWENKTNYKTTEYNLFYFTANHVLVDIL